MVKWSNDQMVKEEGVKPGGWGSGMAGRGVKTAGWGVKTVGRGLVPGGWGLIGG